jgi:hypothetical protein
VAETVGHRFRVNALGNQQRGVGVPEVVESKRLPTEAPAFGMPTLNPISSKD